MFEDCCDIRHFVIELLTLKYSSAMEEEAVCKYRSHVDYC